MNARRNPSLKKSLKARCLMLTLAPGLTAERAAILDEGRKSGRCVLCRQLKRTVTAEVASSSLVVPAISFQSVDAQSPRLVRALARVPTRDRFKPPAQDVSTRLWSHQHSFLGACTCLLLQNGRSEQYCQRENVHVCFLLSRNSRYPDIPSPVLADNLNISMPGRTA